MSWQSTNLMQPSNLAIPIASRAPTFTGNTNIDTTLNLYLRRGSLSFRNRTYVEDATLTAVPYAPQQVPGFITGMQWLNNTNIVLNSNILENNRSMTNFANTQLTLPILYGANTAIKANVACNYQIVVSGNISEENRVNKNANIVAPQNTANSFIANAWCYNNNGDFVSASNIISNVIINYGGNTSFNGVNIQGLDLTSDDATTLPQYTLVYGNSVGSSNASTALTPSNVVFFANVFANGKFASNVLSSSSNVVMNNTPHVANLLLRDVAFSSFNLGSNTIKFADSYQNLPIQPGTNFSYAHYLPEAVVWSNTSTEQLSYKSSADSYLNIITDYKVFNTLPGSNTDVHQVTLYDFIYRYGVEQIKTSNGAIATTKQFINGNVFDPSTNFLINTGLTPGNSVNRVLTGNIQAPPISVYVYENVNGSFNYDAVYPFVLPNSQGVVPVNGNLFPGWQYLTANGLKTYNGNNSSPDFVIPANQTTLQKIRFNIHSQVVKSQTNETPYMVASMTVLVNGITSSVQQRSVTMYPVVHGKQPNGNLNYATPVVCGVAPANGGNSFVDYVILMVQIVGFVGNEMDVSLNPEMERASALLQILPTTTVNSVVRQQVSFSASLRAFPSGSGIAITNQFVNNNWNFITPLFIQADSIFNNAIGSDLRVTLFRQPSNSAIFSFVYSASLAKQLMSFSRTDYYLNGMSEGYNAGVSSTTFASCTRNNSSSEIVDSIYPSFPLIPANASRYYLDTNAVYADISNLYTSYLQLGVLNVARSIEWTLFKGRTQVGRGLISRDPTSSLTRSAGYSVYENLALSSGFVLLINTNITNLASRILLQKLTTNPTAQSPVQWIFNTKADNLNLTVVRMSATSSQNYYEAPVANNRTKQATLQLTAPNSSYDLGAVLGGISNAGKFISLTIRPIRGFNYNRQLTQNFSDALVTSSTFSINVQLDSYAVVFVQSAQNAGAGGSLVNGSNVLFSENNNVEGTAVNDFIFTFNNSTIASQYAATTTPDLSAPNQFGLIAAYQYVVLTNNNNFNQNNLGAVSGIRSLQNPVLNEWKVSVSTATPTVINIKYDTINSRYYFEIGN